MTPDGIHHCRVVPVSHQSPDLLKREVQFHTQSVACFMAQVDEGHRPALAAEGCHWHIMLIGYLCHDPPGGRFSGHFRGLCGRRSGGWQIKWIWVGARRILWVDQANRRNFLNRPPI